MVINASTNQSMYGNKLDLFLIIAPTIRKRKTKQRKKPNIHDALFAKIDH